LNGPAKATVQRGVLGSMTVRNVKNLIQKLLRVPAMRQELSFIAEDPVYAGVMVSTTNANPLQLVCLFFRFYRQWVTH
jgi:hypothetical protein